MQPCVFIKTPKSPGKKSPPQLTSVLLVQWTYAQQLLPPQPHASERLDIPGKWGLHTAKPLRSLLLPDFSTCFCWESRYLRNPSSPLTLSIPKHNSIHKPSLSCSFSSCPTFFPLPSASPFYCHSHANFLFSRIHLSL